MTEKQIETKIKSIFTIANNELNMRLKEDEALYKKLKKQGNKKDLKELEFKKFIAKEKLKSYAKILAQANVIAKEIINDNLPTFFQNGYNAKSKNKVINELVENNFIELNTFTLQELLKEEKIILPKAKIEIEKNLLWNTKKLQEALTVSFVLGESILKTAMRLKGVSDMNYRSAVRNSRTLRIGAEGKGKQERLNTNAKLLADKGYKVYKKWKSARDTRTRASHVKLNFEQKPYNEPFSNGLMYPADPYGNPSEVWNCRCSIADVYVKTKLTPTEKTELKETETIQDMLTNRVLSKKESKQKLLSLGFAEVNGSVEKVDEKILSDNVLQLEKLEKNFSVIKNSINPRYTIEYKNASRTNAYVINQHYNTADQDLYINGARWNNEEEPYKNREKTTKSNWSMPCAKENYTVYTITHEYGHMLENIIVQKRRDEKGVFSKQLEDNNFNSRYDFMRFVNADYKEIKKEIIQIFKENNKKEKYSTYLSDYGKTNEYEFFAESFANSQLGAPNKLGDAMNIWLERNI